MKENGARRWRTVVIEEQTLVRELLVRTIRAWNDRFDLVDEAASAPEALEVCTELAPDLVVLDLALHETDGIELARQLRRRLLGTGILALCESREPVALNRIREVGVQGLIEKDQPIEILEEAMTEVAEGRRYVTAALARAQSELVDDPDGFTRVLSGREQDVLRLVSQGQTSRDIARRLALSPRTVETFRYRLQRKLGVRNTAGLIEYAFRHGLVLPPRHGRPV
ncbi:MAG: response regulator transcription factor [Verrucomicrobiales bacterium]|nr:response regulator transcription factor [Verrucomicrobiales bacterium]